MDEIQAMVFRAAHYRIAGPQGAWLLEPDCHSAPLSQQFARSAQCCASLITAANPAALPLSEAENARRQSRLRARVEALGFSMLEGESSAPDGSWREPTLLCLGMALPVALELAREFGQVAILHAGADAVPRLWPCREHA